MRFFLIYFLLILTACSTQTPDMAEPSEEVLKITEINPNKWTGLTRQNLNHLLQVYDLKNLLFTRVIKIESKIIPNLIPFLVSIHVTHRSQTNYSPSSFMNNCIGGRISNHSEFNSAVDDLKKIYPELPNEGMASDPQSSYLHLLLCHLEYDLLIHFLGKKEANKILKDLIYKDKIYPWIYKQVYIQFKAIEEIILKNRIRPPI